MSQSDYRWARYGAGIAAAGIVLSGPISVGLISATHPQPAWQDAATFVAHYHPAQTLTYWCGFLTITGFLVMFAGMREPGHVHAHAAGEMGTRLALVFAGIFAALISLNYIIQTTFVPALVNRYDPAENAVIAAFTMANPRSLAWALEMWGYGFLGAATWAAAGALNRNRFEKITATLFVLNGIASIATAIWTAVDIGWVLTLAGLIGYVIWNVLIFAAAVMAYVVFKRRESRALSS